VILQAAARVFATHGYAAGTTNRIAERAGVSIGSLYQYFPNKDAILVALTRQHLQTGLTLLAPVLELSPTQSLPAIVRAAVDATIANHRTNPKLHKMLFEEAPRPPSLLAELQLGQQQLVDAVAGILERNPANRRTDLRLAAWMAVTTIESSVHRRVATSPSDLDADGYAEELTDLVSTYLTSAPSRR
jgi:AcrR family transcriptional regulator